MNFRIPQDTIPIALHFFSLYTCRQKIHYPTIQNDQPHHLGHNKVDVIDRLPTCHSLSTTFHSLSILNTLRISKHKVVGVGVYSWRITEARGFVQTAYTQRPAPSQPCVWWCPYQRCQHHIGQRYTRRVLSVTICIFEFFLYFYLFLVCNS